MFAKTEDQTDSLVNAVRIFSKDIKMEFGLLKCGLLILKRENLVKSEGISMPDGRKMKSVEKGGWKYLGILEFCNVNHEEMKGRIKREYMREVRNLLKSKLNGGNTISTINSRAVSIVRYGAEIIRWTKTELEELDQKTRKLMLMYGAQPSRADVDRLYLQRSVAGRGLIGL